METFTRFVHETDEGRKLKKIKITKNSDLSQKVGLCAGVQGGSRWKELMSFKTKVWNLYF